MGKDAAQLVIAHPTNEPGTATQLSNAREGIGR